MIFINDIPSLRAPESCEFNIDDRIEKVELINGNAIQDYGHVESGDNVVLSCIFTKENFDSILALWRDRIRVNFTDESGIVWRNMRLVFKSYKNVEKFSDYVILNFELWRI